jgi:hypothetical protein
MRSLADAAARGSQIGRLGLFEYLGVCRTKSSRTGGRSTANNQSGRPNPWNYAGGFDSDGPNART